MILRWLGIAFLAFSWLLGLGYYHDGGWPTWVTDTAIGWQIAAIPVWVIPVVVGSLLLAGSGRRVPNWRHAVAAIVLLLPGLLLAPWPHRAGLLLIAIGLALSLIPKPRQLWERLGFGGIVAGAVLLAQSLAMCAYETVTAHSHDLPRPLAWLMVGVAKLLGINATFNGTNVVIHSMRETNHLAPTWDFFLPPTTLCFFVGAIVFLAAKTWADAPRDRRTACFWKAAGTLAAAMVLWLPLRAGLQMALYLHRVLRTGYDDPLVIAHQLWSRWPLALFLLGPVLIAWRLARVPVEARAVPPDQPSGADARRIAAAAVYVFVAVAALTGSLFWDPVGERQAGRVIIDEHLSRWESTERPYDTEWYDEDKTLGIGQKSAYNYAVLYDYCSRFYHLSRLGTQLPPKPGTSKAPKTKVTDAVLADCDVFIIKCPTERYSPAEIEAIHRFVERGGGLMLVGEHTNVFQTGTSLNDIAEKYGFRFRYDCLFGPDAIPFDQLHPPAFMPHPIAQRMPPMDFAISCSIEPKLGSGRTVIRGRRLKSLPAYYHASNFYPAVEVLPYTRYGSFVQLWATRYGKGRVVAYADSTILSTFSLFEPGKAEMSLGMIEWLNHRDTLFDPRWLLAAIGVVLLAVGIVFARGRRDAWVILLAAGTLGWASAAAGIRSVHDTSMPAPVPREGQAFVNIIMDRTVCDAKLSKSGFVGGRKGAFVLFERWILRRPYITVREGDKEKKVLREGYFTSRRKDADAFTGDLLVFLYPHKQPDKDFLARLVRYVEDGGRVLVIDSPENASEVPDWVLSLQGLGDIPDADDFVTTLGLDGNSTANALLEPFGMSVTKPLGIAGKLETPDGWPSVPVVASCVVNGGRPLVRLKGRTVAATKTYGKGSVTVLGFGQRFTDPKMGASGDIVPDERLRKVYDLEFKLIPAIVADRLPVLGPSVPPAAGGARSD